MFKLFTWWNSITPGGRFDISRRSEHIGTDEYGNKYYQDRKNSVEGRQRRYVIYNGMAEPSKVPAEWHGWLHYTLEHPPTEAPLARREWETDHSPNMTGTVFAYRPSGSLKEGGKRKEADSDYEAWNPDA